MVQTSDSVQNNASFSSQVKGKKRVGGDHGSNHAKKQCLSKAEDGDFGQYRAENMLKSEIAKITEKGGLVDFEGVEKLVQLMQPSSADKKIDLAGRIMLVDVIAVTDKFDCLGRFVQLRGLPVLDEWLQEVHKGGKIGDGSSPKESDRSVEEFLLTLLCALDKLPVNIDALQSCNIGKSVNHLRSHKNSEIQKKARSLVDTWKKRVEAEMTMNDAKSGSSRVPWPTKPAPSEVSYVANKKYRGLAEVGMKSSWETVTKLSASPGSMKLLNTTATGITKDSNFRMSVSNGTSDLPLTPIKEEKSSSSSQSQNNSQSCSSDHAKTVGSSCREDARSSTAGSVSANKISTGASRHRKSSRVQKESGSGKVSTSNRNLTSEKASPFVVSREKVPDVPLVDHGNNQRLIVRLPKTDCSPSRDAMGGSFEAPAVMCSRASPSAEKRDNLDRKVRGKNDALQGNSVSNMNSDVCHGKDELAGYEEGNELSTGDERLRAVEDGKKLMEGSRASGPTPLVLPRSGKSYEASLSSINALIESCVQLSEANASASPGDDVGMNLLASVAAGEISKSDNVSPLGSPRGNSPALEESCLGIDGKLGHMVKEDGKAQCQPNDGANDVATAEQDNTFGLLLAKNELKYPAIPMLTNVPGDSKFTSVGCEKRIGECSALLNSSSSNLQQIADGPCFRSDVKAGELTHDASLGVSSSNAKKESYTEVESVNRFNEHGKSGAPRGRSSSVSDSKLIVKIPLPDEDKKVDYADERTVENTVTVVAEATGLSAKVENQVIEKSPFSSLKTGGDIQNVVDKDSSSGILTEKKKLSLITEIRPESTAGKSEDVVLHFGSGSVLQMESMVDKDDNMKSCHIEQSERQITDVGLSVSDHNIECAEEKLEKKHVLGRYAGASVSPVDSTTVTVQENELYEKSSGCKLDVVEGDRVEECHASSAYALGSAAGSGMALMLDFDLNEGFPVDDATQGDSVKPAVSGTASPVHLPCPLTFPISSIAVAAAAKGPFVPPENMLWNKGDPSWKGSAATSAFRPAEPRKNLDMPLNTSDVPAVDNAAGRQGRPPLDFDLNMPDERVLVDVASHSSSRATCFESGPCDRGAGGLDLDLNRLDESPDVGPLSVSSSSKFEIPHLPRMSSLSRGLSNGGVNVSRDFDLNNGPGLDELSTETAPRGQHVKSIVPFPAPAHGVRMNSAEFGNFSSWFPPGSSYSAVTVPSVLPSRGEQSYVAATGSQRILAPLAGSTSFGPEIYRGPVLSSSPAVAFPPSMPFQYPGFPFETSFPLSSNSFLGNSKAYMESSSGATLCFPTIPSQLVGPAGVVSSPFPRPYVMSLTGGTSTVGPESRKWDSQGLDLNAGPGGTDIERRDERLPSALRQMPFLGSQSLAEEQMKMYQVAGAVLKRKEPDGGWDAADRFSYKQSSWR